MCWFHCIIDETKSGTRSFSSKIQRKETAFSQDDKMYISKKLPVKLALPWISILSHFKKTHFQWWQNATWTRTKQPNIICDILVSLYRKSSYHSRDLSFLNEQDLLRGTLRGTFTTINSEKSQIIAASSDKCITFFICKLAASECKWFKPWKNIYQ